MSAKFEFDDVLFFHNIKQKQDCKAKIWISPKACNYKILNGAFDDDDIGFEVYSEPTQFIAWDITYADIERLGIWHRITSVYLISGSYNYIFEANA